VFSWLVANGTATAPPSGFNGTYNPGVPSVSTEVGNSFGLTVAVAVALVVVLPMVVSLLTGRNTRHALTDRRLVTTTGLVGRYVRDASLDRIQDVTTEYGVLGRSMDFGDLVFATASASGPWWGLRSGRHGLGVAWLGVPHPLEVRRSVFESMERNRIARTPPGPRPGR
jgi:hypothetical protein